ncbi:MAG: arginine repressor [Clostridia bacterium]|nr:arginine repressor [Clostridia bacterium]
MLREERQAKILEIIAEKEIETQEELCDALNESNFLVTQATISRDIKQLGLIKVGGEKKKYRYSFMRETDGVALSGKMRHLFKESIVDIQAACNLVVIKTVSGNGANAGSVLDKLSFSEVIGTVAGDDTVFAACHSNEDALKIVDKLNDLLK